MKNYTKTFAEFLNESAQVKTVKFKDLSIDDGVDVSGGNKKLILPTERDSMSPVESRLGSRAQEILDDYKKEMIKRYPGIQNATVTIDPNNVWFKQVHIDWKPFLKAQEDFIKGKAGWHDEHRGHYQGD